LAKNGVVNYLYKSDIDNFKLDAREALNIKRGRELAYLIYIDGYKQQDAVAKVFPNSPAESCAKHSSRVIRQYKVLDRLYDLLPDKIREDEFEKMFNWLKERAFNKNDDKMILELLDRYGKAFNKFKQDFNVTIDRGEDYIKRLECAKKLLVDQGVDLKRLIE